MTNNASMQQTLIERLVAKAERDPDFIASALAIWREQMKSSPSILLDCRNEDLWKLALVKIPSSGTQFSKDVLRISESLSCSHLGLAKLIRFAEAARKLLKANEQGLLRAARMASDEAGRE